MLSGIVSNKEFKRFHGKLIHELKSAEEIKFYPGKRFRLAEDPWQRKHGKETKYHTNKLNHTVYTFTQDHNFPDYAANLIPDTNLVAAIGPINTEYAARLLKSTVFNKHFPIATIVCFGTHGKIKLDGQLDLMRDDFINYFMQKSKVSFSTGNNQYFVTSTLIKQSQKIQHYQLDCRHGDEEKTLNVYLYITRDGRPFIPKTAEDIQLAIQVSEITRSEYVLSHCHAGVGRTGQFILQNIINARFSELVDFSDVMKSVKNIQLVLDMIRQTRPAFIHNKAQLLAAVSTAFNIEELKLESRNASSQTTSNGMLTSSKPNFVFRNEILNKAKKEFNKQMNRAQSDNPRKPTKSYCLISKLLKTSEPITFKLNKKLPCIRSNATPVRVTREKDAGRCKIVPNFNSSAEADGHYHIHEGSMMLYARGNGKKITIANIDELPDKDSDEGRALKSFCDRDASQSMKKGI